MRRIPRGRVLTYGQVARLLGVPRGARAVGWALRALPVRCEGDVPWHRVVGAGGRISPRAGPGPELQRRRLRAERVRFSHGCVDLGRHAFWSAPPARRATEPAERTNTASASRRGSGASGSASAWVGRDRL